MTQRYVGSVVLALLVTLLLFTLMQSLLGQNRRGLAERRPRTVFEFVRLPRDENLETKRREKPEKPKQEIAPIPRALAQTTAPVKQSIAVPRAMLQPELALTGSPHLGGGPASDADVIPLVRVNPQYPVRAQARGIEGWVHLEFTITPQGTTTEIVVLDSDPKGYFERAAVNAVKKYKYKPRVEGGVPVLRPGVQVVLSFEIGD